MEQDKEKKSGTLTVKIKTSKKNANAAAQAEEKKFTISQDTKFEKITGKKDDIQRSAGTLADVHQGSVVAIALKDTKSNVAERVEIRPGKKGN